MPFVLRTVLISQPVNELKYEIFVRLTSDSMLRRCVTGVYSQFMKWSFLRRHASVLSATATCRSIEDVSASLTDLTTPASWYPLARLLRRRIVAHLGPTNSGKTHAALTALSSASSGIYCGPLRLLAWEVAQKLNVAGVACSLVTGQEIRQVQGANHTACTVEMASTTRNIGVAVIDEVQLMGDGSRGWAFTRALLGVPAKEVHVCGDPAVLPLLQRLCVETNERLEVCHYERLSPLRVLNEAVESLESVRHGDCIVAFSRRAVHAIRHQIESQRGLRCALVYGALPPEARSQQTALFNAPRSGIKVLAASDAVGMGLNLTIKRIVFSSMSKYDGKKERNLHPAEVKQIAGRAGRYGTKYATGHVTTLHAEDLDTLHHAMACEPVHVPSAAVFPRFAQLSAFAGTLPEEPSLVDVLDEFASRAHVDKKTFFLAQFEEMRANAMMLRHLPLTLHETYVFSISPCDPTDPDVSAALLLFATVFANRRPVSAHFIRHPPLQMALSSEELARLEAIHRVYDLYIWLSFRFETEFFDRPVAIEMRSHISSLIDASLRQLGALSSA